MAGAGKMNHLYSFVLGKCSKEIAAEENSPTNREDNEGEKKNSPTISTTINIMQRTLAINNFFLQRERKKCFASWAVKGKTKRERC